MPIITDITNAQAFEDILENIAELVTEARPVEESKEQTENVRALHLGLSFEIFRQQLFFSLYILKLMKLSFFNV